MHLVGFITKKKNTLPTFHLLESVHFRAVISKLGCGLAVWNL